VIVAIAATKCDLEEERAVKAEEGRALAAKIHADFYETSSKESLNVEEVFRSIAEKLCQRIVDKSKHLPDKEKER
jgi:GTPase SAR1 family protein